MRVTIKDPIGGPQQELGLKIERSMAAFSRTEG